MNDMDAMDYMDDMVDVEFTPSKKHFLGDAEMFCSQRK